MTTCRTTPEPQAPKARKIAKTLTHHGHTRTDHYYWLNNRDDQEVTDYLEAENRYTQTMLSDTDSLQEKLFNEITGRIAQTDMSVPYILNGYYYYIRYEEGQEYPIYCRKKENLDATEELLLDVNELAKKYEYYQVAGITVSPDNKKIAFGVDTIGRRIYTIHFKNLQDGLIQDYTIEGTNGSAYWANDNHTLFFTEKDPITLRSHKTYRTKYLSTSAPELVFDETDDTYYSSVYKSRSRKYLIIVSSATLSDEYRILSADNPNGDFRIFQPRQPNLEYSISHHKGKFYVRTNWKAQNFRLMETPETATGMENWQEIIPHREAVLLEGFTNFDDYLILDERYKGNTMLRIINTKTQNEHYIDFGEDVYTAWVATNPEFSTHILRYGYSSMTTPTSTYDYNMETRHTTLLKRQEVVGGHNPDAYHSERLYAQAPDGKEVALSMVYRKGTPLDGSAPLVLYAYGSYGNTIDPGFGSARLSLLDRGFIFAIAHVRGGQFYGREWYDNGKLLHKMNTFTDFIAVTRFLIDHKYTSADRLMAMGGSAGGLLVGAVINMHPELYKGVIAAVPFVDILTTMLDDSIPLTTGEYDEWGNPNEKEYYDYILSYSPYDNVKPMNYPNLLVTTGFHDSQVQYWEPAKWVAKLRDQKTDQNLLLLHTNMEAGHGGASGRFKPYRETAMEYAFFMKLLGMKE